MNNVNFPRIIDDKRLIHDMHQRFLIEISDIIILVVNKMSFQDQLLMYHILDLLNQKRAIDKLENKQNSSFLIILHNFANLKTIESVEDYIVKDILNGKENITQKMFSNNIKKRQFISDDPNITQLVMANKYSEAGEFYNKSTIEFIRNKIKYHNVIKNADITMKFFDFLKKNIHNYYLDYENVDINFINKDNGNILIYPKLIKSKENESGEINEEINNDGNIVLNKIALKNPILNHLGFVCNISKEIQVKYSIKYNENCIGIIILLPGINNARFEKFEIETQMDEKNSFFFVIKIIWDNCFKNIDERFPKKFYQTCVFGDKEINFQTVKIPFNGHMIDINSHRLIFIENGIISIEIDYMKNKKIFFKKKI